MDLLHSFTKKFYRFTLVHLPPLKSVQREELFRMNFTHLVNKTSYDN